jgi:surface carbohydrate biosynthesis protein
MEPLRIALIVDHPLRDLPGLTLIGQKLANAGAKVFLVPMFVQEREVFTLRPDFVLFNYFRGNNEGFVEKVIASGIRFGLHDTEGGFYGDMKNYEMILSQRRNIYENISCNLVWGQRMLDFWNQDWAFKHPATLTGVPRFDFYSPAFRNHKWGEIPDQFIKKPMVMINTKVGLVNPLFQSPEQELELYRKKLNIPESTIQHLLHYGKKAVEDTIQLARDVAEERPSYQVVVRPHPHENHRTYENGIQGAIENLSVYREGPVIPWVLSSPAMLHRHCTTAIETALAGRTAIAPQWVHTSAHAPDAEAVSFQPKTKQEMFELIDESCKKGFIPLPPEQTKNLQRLIDTWMFQVDGESHQRAATAILQSQQNTRALINDKKTRSFALSVFENKVGFVGKGYHLFNQGMGRMLPSALWKMEQMRLNKIKKSQKFFTPEHVELWRLPDSDQTGKKLNIDWASTTGEFDLDYPGLAIKMEMK